MTTPQGAESMQVQENQVPTKAKGGRPPKVEWEAPFFAYYEQWGNARKAATVAGVSYELVRRRAKADPAFKRAYREAYRGFVAHLEETLVRMGVEKNNVVAVIARLKAAGRQSAERYSEKAVDARVMNVNVHLEAAPADAPAILERMFAALSHDEQRAMRGEVIEAEPLMLTGGGPPADASQTPEEETP